MTQGKYANVNGLNMYYELHGTGRPLVLLHGALSALGTSFGKLLPFLAKNRQVVAIEQQAHGHTEDIDHPLTIKQMADDTVALLGQLNIENADFFGYSMGAGIALYIAIQYPDLVRKLVISSVTHNNSGIRPELLAGMENLKPENLAVTPWQEEYASISPNPEDWPTLVDKVKQLSLHIPDLPAEAVQSIKAPTLVIIGDSDIVRPEHAVEVFRLLGGVPENIASLSQSQLAVLSGATHVSVVDRSDWLIQMILEFLDTPMPDDK
jgi:pimeloyl-ACP methyl ester carboxylesterase